MAQIKFNIALLGLTLFQGLFEVPLFALCPLALLVLQLLPLSFDVGLLFTTDVQHQVVGARAVQVTDRARCRSYKDGL